MKKNKLCEHFLCAREVTGKFDSISSLWRAAQNLTPSMTCSANQFRYVNATWTRKMRSSITGSEFFCFTELMNVLVTFSFCQGIPDPLVPIVACLWNWKSSCWSFKAGGGWNCVVPRVTTSLTKVCSVLCSLHQETFGRAEGNLKPTRWRKPGHLKLIGACSDWSFHKVQPETDEHTLLDQTSDQMQSCGFITLLENLTLDKAVFSLQLEAIPCSYNVVRAQTHCRAMHQVVEWRLITSYATQH